MKSNSTLNNLTVGEFLDIFGSPFIQNKMSDLGYIVENGTIWMEDMIDE